MKTIYFDDNELETSPDFVSRQEVMTRAGFTIKTFQRWATDGRLKGYYNRAGNRCYYLRSDVRAVLEERNRKHNRSID